MAHWVVAAEDWRRELLRPSEQRPGSDFKGTAQRLAGEMLQSGRPLDHNAAEAVLLGYWALGKLR